MKGHITTAVKGYFNSYTGLSATCRPGLLVNLIESTLVGICYFLPLYFVNQLNISVAAAGSIISCYGLGTMLGSYLGGKLADKISPGFVSILCLLIQAIAFILLTELTSPYWLMLNLFSIGITSYGFITANYLWVLAQCEEKEAQKLKAINLLGTLANLGLGMSAILISLLSHIGFKYIILIFSAALFAAAIYFSFHERKMRLTQKTKKIDAHSNQLSPAVLPISNKKIFGTTLGCLFLAGLIVAQINSTYPLYIHDAFPDMGINGFSLLFGINVFMVVLIQTPFVNLFSDHNKMFIIGIGTFLLGIGMFMLIFSVNFFLAIIACIIYTIGEMLFFSMAQLVCYQHGSKNKKGHSLGLYRMIFAIARFVGPASGAFVYQAFGGNMIWYLCGLIGVVGLSICAKYQKYA